MKTTVLLIEDSRFLRIANERALSKAGYQVISASDGEAALRVARERLPDIVLLDMLLPKLDGQRVLTGLKEDSHTAHIPVIVLSSLPQSNEERLKRDGAAAYIQKSQLLLDSADETLLAAVAKVVRRMRASDKTTAGA
jgi:DNA-binding response OmpR family regulator